MKLSFTEPVLREMLKDIEAVDRAEVIEISPWLQRQCLNLIRESLAALAQQAQPLTDVEIEEESQRWKGVRSGQLTTMQTAFSSGARWARDRMPQQTHNPGLAAYDEAKAAGKLGSECVAAYIEADRAQAQPCLYCDRLAHPCALCQPCYQSLSNTGRLPDDRPNPRPFAGTTQQQAQPLTDEKEPSADRDMAHSREYVAGYNAGFERAASIARDRMAQQAQPAMPSEESIAAIIAPAAFGADGGEPHWNYFRNNALSKARAVLALFAKETTQQAQPQCEHGETVFPHRVPGGTPSESGSWSGPYMCQGPVTAPQPEPEDAP